MTHVHVHSVAHPIATQRSLRLAGTLGMAILPIFALVVVLLTWLEWDFLHGIGWTVLHEHKVNYPSSLSRGDFGVVQTLNFLMIGVFTVIFGQGLRTQFIHRWSGAVAVVGFCAVGMAGVLSAFPTDLPDESLTWHGLAHGMGFLLLLAGSAVTFIASGLALRGAAAWKGYWVYSLLNYPLAIAVSVALSVFGQVSFYGLVAMLLAWYGVMGMRLRQLGDELL